MHRFVSSPKRAANTVSELLLSTERNSTFNLSYSNMERHTCDTAA